MIANGITFSRILFSLVLFACPPSSALFAVLYLLCGTSDVLDGFVARKLHTESKTGERLDSIADAVFAAAYAVKILPLLRVPIWILVWTALIGGAKIFAIIRKSRTDSGFSVSHSRANKLTGLLIFLLPMTVCAVEIRYSAAAVCAVATVAAIREFAPF